MLRKKDPENNEVSLARTKWDSAHRRANPRAQFAMSHPVVSDYIHGTYLGGARPLGLLKKHLSKTPISRGLELACGRGDLALGIASAGFVKHVDAFDVSEQAVALANEKAAKRGLTNIKFNVADVNQIELPENTYDLVIFSQSLHHIENLEHVYKEINKSLTSDGAFFVSDYVGPSRMQWTDTQLHIMNEILSVLPEEYRCLLSSELGYHGTHKNFVRRVPVATYLKSDPSEGVRSADILPLAREYFEIIEEHSLGGTINYELLRGIAHNFDENDEKDATILRLILLLEKLLIEANLIDSDFKCFIARKRNSSASTAG